MPKLCLAYPECKIRSELPCCLRRGPPGTCQRPVIMEGARPRAVLCLSVLIYSPMPTRKGTLRSCMAPAVHEAVISNTPPPNTSAQEAGFGTQYTVRLCFQPGSILLPFQLRNPLKSHNVHHQYYKPRRRRGRATKKKGKRDPPAYAPPSCAPFLPLSHPSSFQPVLST